MAQTTLLAQPSIQTLGASKPSQSLPEPFVFVPITGAEASKGRGSAKQIVRAHVTRVQHAKSSTLSFTQNLESWTVNPQVHRPQPSFSESQSQIPRRKAAPKRSGPRRAKTKKVPTPDADADDIEEVARQSAPEAIAVVSKVPRIPAAKRLSGRIQLSTNHTCQPSSPTTSRMSP
jgi:hypothetical protein